MSEEIRKRNEEMSMLIGLCTPPNLSGELPQSQKDKLPVYTREDMARCWDECEKAWGDFRRADWAYNKMTFKHNQPQPPANPYREIKKETL